ncbi:MAG: hypothetical protein AAF065_06120 [Verrucomicrobiota bacterium]
MLSFHLKHLLLAIAILAAVVLLFGLRKEKVYAAVAHVELIRDEPKEKIKSPQKIEADETITREAIAELIEAKEGNRESLMMNVIYTHPDKEIRNKVKELFEKEFPDVSLELREPTQNESQNQAR